MSILAAARTPLIAALVASVLGCRSDSPPPDPITPATDAEADAFGQAMAKALAPCDPAAVSALLDVTNLARRAAHGRKIPKAAKDGMLQAATGNGFGKNLCQALPGETTKATYLRSRKISGSPRPLVRLIIGSALNYLEFEVGRVKGVGEVRAIDYTSFATGESMSEMLGRTLEEMSSNGRPSEALADIEALKLASVKMAQEDVASARANFDKLSAKARTMKAALVVDVQITSQESDEAYMAAMERFARAFPDDPALLLQSIDRSFVAKDFDQTLVVLEKLQRQVGGDPYLDTLQATTLGELGRNADAVSASQRCIQAEPSLENCWLALTDAQLRAQDYGAIVGTMRELKTRFDLDFTPTSLASVPEWAGFLASPEGKAWVAAFEQ